MKNFLEAKWLAFFICSLNGRGVFGGVAPVFKKA